MSKTIARRTPSAAKSVVVDSRKTVKAARRQASAQPVVGFGCPAVDWPHHLRVLIPTDRAGDIVLVEDFGIAGHTAGRPDEVERCTLPRPRWTAIAEAVKREFNDRLRALGLPSARWQSGDNKVERMLGHELLALAWPVGAAEDGDLSAILASWQALRPEERWWLAGRVAANPTARVRKGLAMLLSAGPVVEAKAPRLPVAQRGTGDLPLFEIAKTS